MREKRPRGTLLIAIILFLLSIFAALYIDNLVAFAMLLLMIIVVAVLMVTLPGAGSHETGEVDRGRQSP